MNTRVQTVRFGEIEIADDRVITFPEGMLGFPDDKRYALIKFGDDICFFWLQSIDHPNVAFVVTDPATFVPDYQVPTGPQHGDAQILVIVNRAGEHLTGNLVGPLVINSETRVGEQIVLRGSGWGFRHELIRVGDVETSACDLGKMLNDSNNSEQSGD